jgi:hypothetical protein
MAAYFRLIIKTIKVIRFAESPNHLKHCSKQNTFNQTNTQKERESEEESPSNKKPDLRGVSKWELTGGRNINAYQFPGHMTGKRQTWHSTHMKTRLYSVFMKYSAQSV